jgi:hypothetical protein
MGTQYLLGRSTDVLTLEAGDNITLTKTGTNLVVAGDPSTLTPHHETHEPGGTDVLELTADSRLFGRGAGAGAGPLQEIALGTNLSMSGTTLNASGGGGGGTPDAHHATHEPGGTDVLVNAAWTDLSNTFTDDQIIDGDLLVTGTITPLTATHRDRINALVGDASGARALMSEDYTAGLSLRHDTLQSLGRIACGNYDTQTYQPLRLEVENFQVHSGVSPADRVEHLRVHPLGGLTVGATPDHDADPGLGIVQAHGLGTTPLNASRLTSGTLPDARLSANVQMKPVLVADLPATVATKPLAVADIGPVPPNTVLGRAATSGAAQPLTIGSGLLLDGTTLIATEKNSGVFSYTFSTATTAPPSNQTLRFDAGHPYTSVSKVWVDYHNANSEDLYVGWMGVKVGSILLVQDKDTHQQFAEFIVIGVPVDKGNYAELPVTWRASGTALASQAVVVQVTLPSVATAHHATHEPGGNDALVNAAWTDRANTFVAAQTISAASPQLTFNETGQPADQRRFRLIGGSQQLWIQAVDDAQSVAHANPFKVDRQGNAYIENRIFEKNRTTALGYWIDVPYNAANFGATGGTWSVPAAARFSYALDGTTAHIQLWIDGSTIGGAPSSINLVLPFTILAQQSGTFHYVAGSAFGPGLYSQPSQDGYVRLYRDLFGTAFPATSGVAVRAALTVQIL